MTVSKSFPLVENYFGLGYPLKLILLHNGILHEGYSD
jgi:hypothetical protein